MKFDAIIRTFAASIAAAALLAGCATAPPIKLVTLSPPQTERLPSKPSDWKVRRVRMPEYLDSYDIELRTENYLLTKLPGAKWAERLPAATTRLLQQTIDAKLETKRDRHYEVHVSIDTFEPQPSGKVVLSGSWRVTNSHDHVVARHDALIKESAPSSKGQSGKLGRPSAGQIGMMMSTAVRELAMQIVARAS